MRISQELANKIALKMTEVTAKKVAELHEEFKVAVSEAYKNTIPKEVMDFAAKHPEYIKTCYDIRLNGNGWNQESVPSVGKIPSISSGYDQYEPDRKEADRLKKLKHSWEDAKKAYKTLLSDTENALLSLRTFARIKEQFPEAEKYLPPPMSNMLMVNFESLQSRLKKQPVTKSEKEPNVKAA